MLQYGPEEYLDETRLPTLGIPASGDAQQLPYLGERLTSQPCNVGTAHAPALEAIAQLKPDLILGDC